MIHFSSFRFQPVIPLSAGYEVFDFTGGYDPERDLKSPFGIGRYNEDRRGMYDASLFQAAEGPRTIHMGIDIGSPVGTPVHAFFEGEIFLIGNNDSPGDYGYTLITKHSLGGEDLYALFGHLAERSVKNTAPGRKFRAGDVIAWVGDRHENGGWNPHGRLVRRHCGGEACEQDHDVRRWPRHGE